MTRHLLTALLGLALGMHLRHAPHDWPEYALAVARRMTFNDSGSQTATNPGSASSRVALSGPAAERGMLSDSYRTAVAFTLKYLGFPRFRVTMEMKEN